MYRTFRMVAERGVLTSRVSTHSLSTRFQGEVESLGCSIRQHVTCFASDGGRPALVSSATSISLWRMLKVSFMVAST